MNGLSEEAKSDDKLDCLTKYDYWYTWKESGLLGALLGGYFGLVHQNSKYGGQLFIQQKIDQLRKSKLKRFVLRCLIILALCIPAIIGFIVLELLREQPDLKTCDPEPALSMLIVFFEELIVYSLTAFVIFAYSDSLCLRAGLYDRAPTHGTMTFNKDDEMLGEGVTHILGD